MQQLPLIAADYAPYDKFPEFAEGYAAYLAGRVHNPHGSSVAGQAWDRGAECAMRAQRWTARNVGAD